MIVAFQKFVGKSSGTSMLMSTVVTLDDLQNSLFAEWIINLITPGRKYSSILRNSEKQDVSMSCNINILFCYKCHALRPLPYTGTLSLYNLIIVRDDMVSNVSAFYSGAHRNRF